MTSFKSKMFNFLMRNRHWFQGKLKRETFDDDTSIEKFREECEKGAGKYAKIPEGVTMDKFQIGSIPAEWIIPEKSPENKVILYVHGGGYVSGSLNDHRGFVSKFTKQWGYKCLQYEYRLAPETPFPGALDDSVLVYEWLMEKGYGPENILLVGESAGGGLLLALLLVLKDRKIPLPKAAAAMSPWTDLSCSSESYKTKRKVSVAPENSWLVFSKHYTAGQKARNPLISPLFGDLKGLPPLYINSGESDELFEDGKKFYEKAKKAGVEATFKAGEGMVHCYPLLSPFFREAEEAMEEITCFIQAHLG